MTALLKDDGAVAGAYRTAAISRGTTVGTVSSQWWSRPDDQKFLDLDSLYTHTKRVADYSRSDLVDASKIVVEADRQDNEKLSLIMPGERGGEFSADPTHFSFGQVSSLAGAPAGYLRKLPGFLAAINLQYGLNHNRGDLVRTYTKTDGTSELRAATGPDYGRIHDHEVVSAVMKVAGNGTGDTPWKVPGMIDWNTLDNGTITYNPYVSVTKDTTTLYASDRDVFLFLVDDTHPIEIGLLPDGSPDLIFRGFYAWNSEVGDKSCGIATFLLRAVCQNRMLWGVEGFQEMTMRHSKLAPSRFIQQAAPALASYAESRTDALLNGINTAKNTLLADDKDAAVRFLNKKQGFSQQQSRKILATLENEEGKTGKFSAWDFVQGITAVARNVAHTDDRLDLEKKAGALMAKAAR